MVEYLIGKSGNRYAVLELAGEGGEAEIYKVSHEDGDIYAGKVMSNTIIKKDKKLARFRNEIGVLHHAEDVGGNENHIIPVFDYGGKIIERDTEENRLFYIMPLMGKNFRECFDYKPKNLGKNMMTF